MASSGKELDVGPGLVGNCHWTAEELGAVVIGGLKVTYLRGQEAKARGRLSLHRPGQWLNDPKRAYPTQSEVVAHETSLPERHFWYFSFQSW